MERKSQSYYTKYELLSLAMEVAGIAIITFEAAKIYSTGKCDDLDFPMLTILGCGLYGHGRLLSNSVIRERIKSELEDKASEG
jgi:uncharacterized protein YegL